MYNSSGNQRNVAQFGRALALGARGRRFESYHSDWGLTNNLHSFTIYLSNTKAMSRSKFHSKFKSDLKKLTAAVEGTIALDEDYPKLYQKLIRFYEDQGVQLYDDPEDDYNVILDNVESDLIESGVYA